MTEFLVGDAFDLLPRMEDHSVDLVLTDPPYDLLQKSRITLQQEFLRVTRTGVIVFCPPENLWYLPASQYLFWIKPISTKNTSKRYSRFVEMILVYGNVRWVQNRHWSQYTNVFTDLVDEPKHAHRKPPSLIERLLRNHSLPGDTILDPFAGSGVVGEIAKGLGRKTILIDINPRYS